MNSAEFIAKVRRRARADVHLVTKKLRQRVEGTRGEATAVFLIGVQRSGTNMLDSVLDASPYTAVYNEDNPRAFTAYRLRPIPELRALIERSHARRVVFKPLCDAQRMDELVDAFPRSSLIWIYRNHRDTVRSTLQKWPKGQINHLRRVIERDTTHWVSENVPEEHRKLVERFYAPDMPVEDAAALVWYLRSQIILESKRSTETVLVSYDKLVRDPEKEARRVFAALDLPFRSTEAARVHDRSLNQTPVAGLRPEIDELCQSAFSRLVALEAQLTAV